MIGLGDNQGKPVPGGSGPAAGEGSGQGVTLKPSKLPG